MGPLSDAQPARRVRPVNQTRYSPTTSKTTSWVPESARWEALRSAAKQSDIGKRIDDALTVIEAENPKLKGILDKRYARAQLPDLALGFHPRPGTRAVL